MSAIRVNASDVVDKAELAERILAPGGEMVAYVERRLEEAALNERHTHKYQNQTTHLQQSTAAVVVSEDDNNIEVHLEMGEEYASYVVDRGLSNFEEIAADAFSDIDVALLQFADRLK